MKESIRFISENHCQWREATAGPDQLADEGSLSGLPLNRETIHTMQEWSWEHDTGVKPHDSRFTVIIPVHDEERSLPEFFNSFMLSDVPASVPMQVVVITNNCSDDSPHMVRSFIASTAEKVEEKPLPDSITDPGIAPCAYTGTWGAITITHVDTTTPGKSPALEQGNLLALQEDHEIALSFDADVLMDPSTIKTLFAEAYHTIVTQQQEKTLYTGKFIGEAKDERTWLYQKFYNKFKRQDQTSLVTGAIVAWNPKFMHDIQAFLPISSQDYAMGVLTRVNGGEVIRTEDAAVYGYIPASLTEKLNTMRRSVRGRKQLLALRPETTEEVMSGSSLAKPRVDRILDRVSKTDSLASFIKSMAWLIMEEYAVIQGTRDFEKNPHNASWDKILVSKLG